MIRDLSGVIREWNRSAELAYGFSREEAVGKVSHLLLHTVFPMPLKEINQYLLNTGSWEGELLHVLNDGRRVRVQSRWEVQCCEGERGRTIVEFNRRFEELDPETAHFETVSAVSSERSFGKTLRRLRNDRRLWVVLLLVALFAVEVKIELRKGIPPIRDYRR